PLGVILQQRLVRRNPAGQNRGNPQHGSDRSSPLTTRISRRAIFRGLMAGLLGTRHLHAQSRQSPAEGGRVRSTPRPLAKDALTHDWTAFLGPTHNAVSTETKLSRRLPP